MMQLSYKFLLLFTISLFSGSLIGQDEDSWIDDRYIDNYTQLNSVENIPKEFSIPTVDQCISEYEHCRDSLGELDNDAKRQFILMQNYFAEGLFRSGAILYGDEISKYINSIAKIILENHPELSKKIRFYTFKSSKTNAFTTSKGAIYINIGLISRLKSEAELAFVLSHEIGHFLKNHVYNSYVEKQAFAKKKKKYSNKSFGELIAKRYKFEKAQEFEADSIGLQLFSQAGYKVESSKKVMDLLYYTYLPYKEVPFKHDYFNSGNFIIPDNYFPDSIKQIPAVVSRNDRYHTHPNVYKRKAKLDSLITILDITGKNDFIFSERDFLKARENCRFESIWLNLVSANYPDAIYEAYIMQQKYPNNKFLKLAIAKGLYALAKYKNKNELSLIAKRYTSIQGESEALHFMIKHLDRNQLSTLALRYLLDNQTSFNDQTNYKNLRDDIIRDMVVQNELKLDTFLLDSETSISYKHFYRKGIPELSSDQELGDAYLSFYEELEKKKKDFRISYKEAEKRKKQEAADLKNNGYQINAKNIILLDPTYFHISNRRKIDLFKASRMEQEIASIVQDLASENGISVYNATVGDIGKYFNYRQLSLLKFWFKENTIHQVVDITPLYTKSVLQEFEELQGDYVYHVDVYNHNNGKYYSYFDSRLVELKTGKVVYKRSDETFSYYTKGNIEKLIKSDLIKISK